MDDANNNHINFPARNYNEQTPNDPADLAASHNENTHVYPSMTKECAVDRLKQHLATIEGADLSDEYDTRKYYNQAHGMLKIGAFKPAPPFIVFLADLKKNPDLIRELHSLDNTDRTFVLRQAVGRIFEDVNFKIYHTSVSRVLKVKLQK